MHGNNQHLKTQLSLLAADALARFGDDQAAKFADLLVASAGSLRQIGQGTRRAIVRITEGRPWWQSGNHRDPQQI